MLEWTVEASAWIDASFRLTGTSVPLDHGYAMFGAVCRLAPKLREHAGIGIHPIKGKRLGPGVLSLTSRSELTIRLPIDQVKLAMPLAGATLELDGHTIRVGVPQLNPLVPWPRLQARFVTIKGFHGDPQDFARALRRQLEGFGTWAGTVEVEVGERRVMKVSTHTVVGFAVGLNGLDADAAISIQVAGLGGRRHMGAGVFVPPGREP